MGKKKVFPRIDLSIPVIEYAKDSKGNVVIPLDVIPPKKTMVYFPEVGNATARRSFDFSPWYGEDIDEITYACQRQIERFLSTHDGDLSVATVVSYCLQGLRSFLDYLLILCVAENRVLILADINGDVIDGYIRFLDDGIALIGAQKARYNHAKPVLVALGKRGLIQIVTEGDDATFPENPFPNSHRKAKGEKPLPLAQRRAFTAAVKTAIMPLLAKEVEPTCELLSYALLVVALHTGRNLTPLLEMDTNCLRAHPKDNMVFLVCYKRRGNSRSQVPLKENSIESIATAFTSVAQLIRRVIELTATLRLEAPAHLQDRVWLYRAQGGKSYGNISALTTDNIYSTTQKLINDFNLQDSEGKSLRINVRRLRKTFTNRIYEILEEDQIAAAVVAGNTPQVLANYYLHPGENAQHNWKFMGVVLTQELLSSTIGATEKTPVGKCTDIKKGQFAPRKDGVTCMSFLDCVRCRNYVVTGDDLYRLFSFYWRIYAERSRMSGRKWDKHYRHIIRLIDRDVITLGINKKIFRQSDVDAARERGRIDPHPYWSNLNTLEVL